MSRETSRRMVAPMKGASRSCRGRRRVDDMKKRSGRRTLPQALFRHAGPGSIPAIDQGISIDRHRARIMVFMAEYFRPLRAERAVPREPGAAIAQMQLAPGKR